MTVRWTVFLDRDGVLNQKAAPGDYIRTADAFVWLPGSREALERLARAGLRLVVVTNQQGVAKGLIRPEDLERINTRIRDDLHIRGVTLDGIYVCPHLAGTCDCRKPATGLFLDAQRADAGIDFGHSIVVGDAPTDVEAGRRIGARTIYIGRPEAPPVAADAVVRDLAQAAEQVLAWT